MEIKKKWVLFKRHRITQMKEKGQPCSGYAYSSTVLSV